MRKVTFLISCTNKTQSLDSTTAEIIIPKELKLHLDFLVSDDMRGRDTPSNELNIAASYLALDFANNKQMLPLDLNPGITRQGKHNLVFDWTKEKNN